MSADPKTVPPRMEDERDERAWIAFASAWIASRSKWTTGDLDRYGPGASARFADDMLAELRGRRGKPEGGPYR